MLLEIASWTILFAAASLTLPYGIPYFRNKLQEIKSLPTAVFDSTCIQDAHQIRINAIDRSVGQIVGASAQLLITGWACLNLLGLNAYHSLDACVIGFYLYDIFHLLTKPYAKTLHIFRIHHVLSICMICYGYLLDIPYFIASNTLYVVLEFSAVSINITNLLSHCYPSSNFVIPCSFINISIYCVTRIIVYPIFCAYLQYYVYVTTTTTYSYCLCLPALGLLTGLYFACLYWFIGMVTKHRALQQKLIL
jgi:hypothetical protein